MLQAQNVLMKKLGNSSFAGPLDIVALQRFWEVFTATMPISQCEALDELIPDGRPLFNAAVAEIEP